MVIRGQLCRICSGFGFDKDYPPFGRNVLAESNIFKPKTVLKLGLLGQVRVRGCPLCKLVTSATLEIQRTENYLLDDGDEVGLWWLAYAPNCGVFSVWFASRGISRGTVLSFVRLRSQPTHTSPSCLYMPFSQSQIDFGKVRSWLVECETTHSSCYPFLRYREAALGDIFPGLKVLRLIDVHQHCLVEVSGFTRYVTLSYVWGSVPSLRLSRANRHRLMQPDTIRQAWDLIPKTIQDAITMTQLARERYLWVDSLCLVQNDPEDLRHGTSVMDLIYQQSILCIVAAGGKDANAGLAGVSSGSRGTSQTIAEIEPGLQLAVYTDPCYLLQDTVYNSRAWTLQEQALSRRSLYFVNDQVYFRCLDRGYSETMIAMEQSPAEDLSVGTLFKIIRSRPLPGFKSLLELYSQRALTYQSDVSRAIAGITRRFGEKMQNTSFLEGLPIYAFDEFLLFYGGHTSLRRRKGFPSYSWSGWIGRLTFSSTHEPFRNRLAQEFTQEDLGLENLRWISWYVASDSGSKKLAPGLNFDHVMSRRPFKSFYPYLRFSTSRTEPSKRGLEVGAHFPDYTVLQFWTLSAFFRLSNVDVLRGSACLTTRDGAINGKLFMDGYDEDAFFVDRTVFEVILLSTSSQKYSKVLRFFVMCIETRNGISERRGIGWIDSYALKDSLEPGLAWKEIFLA